MARKITPWRRKPKVRALDEGLDSSLTFAVVGNPDKFRKKFHAHKVYHLLKSMGSEVYAVSAELQTLGKEPVYPNLLNLPKQVDVVVPCLPAEFSQSIVREAAEAGIAAVWFQHRTVSAAALEFCQTNSIKVIEGCALKYKEFEGVSKFFDPCYWHSKTNSRRKKYV